MSLHKRELQVACTKKKQIYMWLKGVQNVGRETQVNSIDEG